MPEENQLPEAEESKNIKADEQVGEVEKEESLEESIEVVGKGELEEIGEKEKIEIEPKEVVTKEIEEIEKVEPEVEKEELPEAELERKPEEKPLITEEQIIPATPKEPTSLPVLEPQVVEKEVIRIKEVPRELSWEEKEEIFQSKLKENLRIASKRKQEEYEKDLQEMIDFIKTKGTLVTNQEIEEGLRIPDSTVTDRLNELIKRGLIMRLGTRFSAKYRLTKPI
jgi:uncharacterized membrane protein